MRTLDRIYFDGDHIRDMISAIGDDPNRPGLKDTPSRVIKSWKELFWGYRASVPALFRVFDEPCDEMVIVKNVEFYSTCEHHMLPFFGKAHIAYLPNNGKVVGVSKLVRVLEAYSRRLQIQERICQQVTAALDEYLAPRGSACVLEAKHLCMTCRGVNKQHSSMITSSLTGAFRLEPSTRQEFFQLIKG